MDTTIFTGTAMDACGTQCMDIVTAALISMAAIAIMVVAGVYLAAGVCKRVR